MAQCSRGTCKRETIEPFKHCPACRARDAKRRNGATVPMTPAEYEAHQNPPTIADDDAKKIVTNGWPCPRCSSRNTRTKSTRYIAIGIRRYKTCRGCGREFSTLDEGNGETLLCTPENQVKHPQRVKTFQRLCAALKRGGHTGDETVRVMSRVATATGLRGINGKTYL